MSHSGIDVGRRNLIARAAPVVDPVHISSFIIRAMPDRLEAVMAHAAGMEGVEVHDSDPSGKFIALFEMSSEDAMMIALSELEKLDGVLNTSMVFHQID